jgi:cytidylate kinase
MKPHYDFSKAERGKFYRKEARLRLPIYLIYLDSELQQRLERIAQKNGRDLGDIVSNILAKDVELLEELT